LFSPSGRWSSYDLLLPSRTTLSTYRYNLSSLKLGTTLQQQVEPLLTPVNVRPPGPTLAFQVQLQEIPIRQEMLGWLVEDRCLLKDQEEVKLPQEVLQS